MQEFEKSLKSSDVTHFLKNVFYNLVLILSLHLLTFSSLREFLLSCSYR